MRSLVIIQILLITAICPNVLATIINVPGDFRTIQGAIDHTEAEDTVLVQPGIYEANLRINTSLTLASLTLTTGDAAYIDSTVIDGRQRGSVIAISGNGNTVLLISGFTIRNGIASNGGGLNCVRSTVRLEDLLITQNYTIENGRGSGGGIYADQSPLTVRRVRLIENIGDDFGGGINTMYGSPLTMDSCIILGNRTRRTCGAGLHTLDDVSLHYVLIAQNTAGHEGGAGEMYGDNETVISIDHVTFADNRCNSGANVFYSGVPIRELKNCIVYGNRSNQNGIGIRGSAINVSYCDIEGGLEAFDGDVNAEEITDVNPLFVDPDVADYTLRWDSPCIDAGDPDAEPDPDGTRTDIGAFHFPHGGCAYGVVTGGREHTPLPGATVATSYGRSAICDSVGFFSFVNLVPDSFSLTASLPEFADSTLHDIYVVLGDTLEINFSLLQPILQVDEESVSAEVDSGEALTREATIQNLGDGLLEWHAVAYSRGDVGFDSWSLRQSLAVTQITGDDRIEGVIFDGESYYCAGSNGDDPNLIYRLSREGVLLDSIRQPGFSHYGLKDLEWDGELIWGSDGDAVYGISRSGNVEHAWQAPFFPTNNITYDPEEEILWISATISNIVAYDRDGNNLGRWVDRQGLRIYGLGWYGEDPDSSFLYALNLQGNDSAQINKFNPLTGEMSFVHAFPLDSAASFNSAFICRNYDHYQGWVMMTIANIPAASGGDLLRVYQLEPNREWFTIDHDSGEIPGGSESQITVTLRTAGEDNDWAFELGEYEGEIVFTHNGQGGWDILPVHLRVVEPNDVDQDGYGDPSSFELFTAYPNPFNSSTTITFSVGQVSQPVKLAVYDLQGRLVDELVNVRLSAGRHTAVWDGASLAAGVYLIRLESEGKTAVSKGVIIK